MKNLQNKGKCTLEELQKIVKDLNQVILIANNINNDENLSVNVNIETVKLIYDKGFFEAAITYEAKKEEYERDDKEGTFNEAT